jgi:large subunit ribosomal protein L18
MGNRYSTADCRLPTAHSKEMAMVSKVSVKRRAARVRRQIRAGNTERPRLSIYRSGKNIYAQVIDDKAGRTLAAASTLDKDLKSGLKTGADVSAASAVGKLIAERATKAGVKEVVFDRGPYIFHGRVKALAEAAREGGLSF